MTAYRLGLTALSGLLFAGACEVRDVPRPTQTSSATQQGITRPQDVQATPVTPARFAGIGRAATASEIRAWDIDANPSGRGLPPGRGTVAEGARVYAAQWEPLRPSNGYPVRLLLPGWALFRLA